MYKRLFLYCTVLQKNLSQSHMMHRGIFLLTSIFGLQTNCLWT